MKNHFKRNFIALLLLMFTVLLAACGGNSNGSSGVEASGDDVITIKIADSFPDSHIVPEIGTKPWIERIEELTDGKVKIEYYPGEQLGKAASLLDVAKNKVADITYVGPLYISDALPLSGIVANPGLFQDAVSATKVYNKLVNEDLYELEFKPNGVKPLWSMGTNPYQITNSKHPVKTLDDFKGLKIRTSGGIQEQVMQQLGATPVSIPAPEMYTAWDRGTLDGTLLSLFSWPGYQVDKVTKYATVNAPLSGFGISYVVNEEVWESWPEDVQQAIIQASEEIVETVGISINEHEEELRKEYEAAGVEFYELPDEELAKWNEYLSDYNKEWAKMMDERGLKGTEILDKFLEYSEEFMNE